MISGSDKNSWPISSQLRSNIKIKKLNVMLLDESTY